MSVRRKIFLVIEIFSLASAGCDFVSLNAAIAAVKAGEVAWQVNQAAQESATVTSAPTTSKVAGNVPDLAQLIQGLMY